MISPPSHNLPSLLSLDLNTSEGESGELSIDYLQIICNNNQVKDKYKAGINKVEKCQINLRGAMKGSTLTAGALGICGISVIRKINMIIKEREAEKTR